MASLASRLLRTSVSSQQRFIFPRQDASHICNFWHHSARNLAGYSGADIVDGGGDGKAFGRRNRAGFDLFTIESSRNGLDFSDYRFRCFSSTGKSPMSFGADGNDTETSKDGEKKPDENFKESVAIDLAMQEDSGKAERKDANGVLDYSQASESMDDKSDSRIPDRVDYNVDDDDDDDDDDDEEEDYDDDSEMEDREIEASGSEGSGTLLAHLQSVPKRQRKFLLQKALKIPTKKRKVKIVKRKDLALRELLMRQMRVVDVNRTSKATKGGGIIHFTAFVVCGNCDGVAAFGKGKGQEVGEAVSKAQLRAIKNLHYFDIYKGHTIFHAQEAKYGKTKIRLWPAHSGVGMRACPVVKDILQLAGYKDVKTKVIGSRHPHNTVKAVFKALSMIESPEELSERVGCLVVESRLVQ